MIRRHFTAHSVNTVVNDPSVYDYVRGALTGKLDMTPLVENPDNVLLMGEHGGVIFLKHSPGIYEAHSQVLPAGRGQWTLDTAWECLDWLFTHTDAVDVMTRVPKGNHAARGLALATGWKPEFRVERGWIKDDQIIYADVYSMQIQTWIARSPNLEAEGILFHHKLEQEYVRLGKKEPPHPDDPVHNRYVGAAVSMIRNGQPNKGVLFYLRWAGMAGYAPISIVSADPLIIDIQESLIQVTDDGGFFVLRVK